MFAEVMSIFSHTPVWVWLLLAFLIYRGIAASKPRSVAPPRMLLLPILFLLWSLVSMIQGGSLLTASLTFITSLLCGIAISFWLWSDWGGYNQSSDKFECRGSWRTMILIMLMFISRYIQSVMLAFDPLWAEDRIFVILQAASSGIITGILWGGTLSLFRQRQRSIVLK